MELVLLSIVLIAAGHLAGATLLYLNHRFIFHGSIGRFSWARRYRQLHTNHHRYAFSPEADEFISVPLWGKLMLSVAMITAGFLFSWMFALGLFSFAMTYSIHHWQVHHGMSSGSAHHHMSHHYKANTNFSGVYPVIDKIFGTYEK